MIKQFIRIFFVVTLSSLFVSPISSFIPVTNGGLSETSSAVPVESLATFSQEVYTGRATQIVGAYTEDLFALPVVQQPTSDPAFVSTEVEKATQFSMAEQYGSVGLVAHNNLAGKHFFDLAKGDAITLVYGDGRQANYTICDIQHYQALTPSSPYSKYLNLDHPGDRLDVETVFNTVYGVKGRLVLQTCIANGKMDSWGRLFVIAEPAATGCDVSVEAK